MKRFLSLICLLPVVGFATTLPSPMVISTDLTWTSDYVFRGVRVAGVGFQPTVEIATGDLYAGLWGNFPISDRHNTLHYYGGLGIPVPQAGFLNLDTGFTVYHYPDTGRNRTHEFYLGGLFSVSTYPAARAALYYFYDFDLESHVGEGTLSWLYSLERIGLPAALDFSAHLGVRGGGSVDGYHYYGGAIALPYSLTNFSAVTVTVGYGTAHNYSFAPGEERDTVFWSVGYSTFF